jgi:O-antigen biosynthesis protein WbqP
LLIRALDIAISLFGLIIFSPLLGLILLVLYFSQGSAIFTQERLGLNGKSFVIIKFRTMAEGTISIATHLSNHSDVTPIGHILRRLKFDELPQLLNVLIGDMSLVGPRPGLASQRDLTIERSKLGVYSVKPGITGLAQVSGIDMSTPNLLAKTDARMIKEMSVVGYFKYIFVTVFRPQGSS